MKTGVVRFEKVAKSGNMSADFHLAALEDRSPYIILGGRVLEARRPSQWSSAIWLNSRELSQLRRAVKKSSESAARLEELLLEFKRSGRNNE